jgi:hypothetical protein
VPTIDAVDAQQQLADIAHHFRAAKAAGLTTAQSVLGEDFDPQIKAARDDLERSIRPATEQLARVKDLPSISRLSGLSIEIEYCVTGEVDVELQYGSNSDVSHDIGMRSDDSYPYEARVIAAAGKPLDIDAEAIQLSVDTSSFYE